VTALRSPPLSRMTGRGFAGDGGFVHAGDTLDDVGRRPDDVVASQTTRSPFCKSGAGTFSSRHRAGGGRWCPCGLAQAGGLGLWASAILGKSEETTVTAQRPLALRVRVSSAESPDGACAKPQGHLRPPASDGREEKVPPRDLQKGRPRRLRSQRRHPGRRRRHRGYRQRDEAAVTGESAPVIRESGGRPQRSPAVHAS